MEQIEAQDNLITTKVVLLKNALERKKSGHKEKGLDTENLDEILAEMIARLPKEDLRREEEERVYILKNLKMPQDQLEEFIRKDIERMMVAYIDNREYLEVPNLAYANYRNAEFIGDLLEKFEGDIADLDKIARMEFDLNGLSALNDLGSHDDGDKGLIEFTRILQKGETTRWLENLGINVVAYAKSGDEFGILLSGEINLRSLSEEIKERYFKETEKIKAQNLINLQTNAAEKWISKYWVNKDGSPKTVPENFKFELTTSVGMATLGETLAEEDVGISQDQEYDKLIKWVIGKNKGLADTRAAKHKREHKSGLQNTNPFLYFIYENARLVNLGDKEE